MLSHQIMTQERDLLVQTTWQDWGADWAPDAAVPMRYRIVQIAQGEGRNAYEARTFETAPPVATALEWHLETVQALGLVPPRPLAIFGDSITPAYLPR